MKKITRSKNTLGNKGRVLSAFSGISGSLSFLGGWQICHNLCLGIIAVLSLIGITIAGMPLLFLTEYSTPFWMLAVFILIPTLIMYWKNRKCMSKNVLLVNIGIVIAAIPFDFLQTYNLLFWAMGGIIFGAGILGYLKNRVRGS